MYARTTHATQPVAEHAAPKKPANKALANYIREQLARTSGSKSTAVEIACVLSDEQLIAAYNRWHDAKARVARG